MSENKTTRYLPSWGLAFAEKREMEKLSKLSEQGWILQSFASLGYKLCKGKQEKLIYSLDYQVLSPAEHEEYFNIFEIGGWTHVCSQGSIHVFASKPGTQPIYSDRNTMIEKYKRAITSWRLSAVVFSLLASVCIVLPILFDYDFALIKVLGLLGWLSIILAVPSLMTYMAFVLKLGRLNKG